MTTVLVDDKSVAKLGGGCWHPGHQLGCGIQFSVANAGHALVEFVRVQACRLSRICGQRLQADACGVVKRGGGAGGGGGVTEFKRRGVGLTHDAMNGK